MDTTTCISDQEWEAYSNGRLSHEALQLLLLHAQSCEICTDIKEGIDSMQKPSMLAERVEQIRLELDKRIQPQQAKEITWWKWAAAAAVLLSSAWLAWQWPAFNGTTEKPGITIVQPPDTSPAVPEKIETPLSGTKEKKVIAEQRKSEKQRNSPKTVTRPPESSKVESISPPVLTDAAVSEQKTRVAQSTAQEEDLSRQSLDKAAETEIVKEQISNKKTITQPTPSSRKQASLPSNQLNNNQVLNNFTLPQDSFFFQTATDQFKRKAYDSCLASLNPILQFTASPFYEDALLLEARVYMARAEKRKAQHLLKKIVKMNGRLKKEAQEMMDNH